MTATSSGPGAIAAGLGRRLLSRLRGDGAIAGPDGSPQGTYASGMAALSFGLLFCRTGHPKWSDACSRALSHASARRVESEFDGFARILLASELERTSDGGLCPDAWDARAVRLYDGNRVVSRNWVAMRALSFTVRARLTGSAADARRADGLWRVVLAAQTAAGLFNDAPVGRACPVTYHAKVCAMLALGMSEAAAPGDALRRALIRGLDALVELVTPSGVLVPYGRSRDTLFGSAAAVLALRAGAVGLHDGRYVDAAARVEQRLAALQRSDGYIGCVLDAVSDPASDRDVYVNDADYGAYACAMLLLSEGYAGKCPPAAAYHPADGATRVGPFLVHRANGAYAAFAMEGEDVAAGSPFFCDLRYAGMEPLWIEQGGRVLLRPAPYRWRGGDRSAAVDPAFHPWLPWLERSGARYCVRRYDRVRIACRNGRLRLCADGEPVCFAAVPMAERRARGAFGRILGRPHRLYRVRRLHGVRTMTAVEWDPDGLRLRIVTRGCDRSGHVLPLDLLHNADVDWVGDGSAGPRREAGP